MSVIKGVYTECLKLLPLAPSSIDRIRNRIVNYFHTSISESLATREGQKPISHTIGSIPSERTNQSRDSSSQTVSPAESERPVDPDRPVLLTSSRVNAPPSDLLPPTISSGVEKGGALADAQPHDVNTTARAVDALAVSIIDGQLPKGRLTRLDDQTWAYTVPEEVESSLDEVRIRIPQQHRGRDAYTVATSVAALFDAKIARLRTAVLKTGMRLPIDVEDPALAGAWHIGIPSPKGVVQRAIATITDTVTQALPFTRRLHDRKIVVVDVEKLPIAKKASAVALPILAKQTHIVGGTSNDVLPSLDEQLTAESFQDPFTRLATECFQKYEPFFVMEAAHRGSYRYTVDADGRIRLEENIPSARGYFEQNQRAVRAYVDFLIREYGKEFVAQLETSYAINFGLMIEEGLPLLPDHVSKCNIGVNSIEVGYIERLQSRLQTVAVALQTLSLYERGRPTLARPAKEWLAQAVQEKDLSVREARGLLRAMAVEHPTAEDIRRFLEDCLPTKTRSVRDAEPEAFNSLAAIIMPTDDELDRAFTGRKIRHVSIMGFHTMGDAKTPNPCRDMFELLHVYAQCRRTNEWNRYFELLSHVVAKKSLFRQTPGTANRWHVGLLIPAPDTTAGQRQWYANDAFYDDHSGNVNYVFLPACRNYRRDDGSPLPLIKLYRSTCSDSNAVNWQDSVAADLNPYGSPNSLYPEIAVPTERAYFDERTIPVWMGYLLAAHRKGAMRPREEEAYRDFILKAATACIAYIKKRRGGLDERLMGQIEQLASEDELEKLEHLLTQLGHYFQEDPQYKVAQDMVFAGHSLGGALAQFGMQRFLSAEERLPLPVQDAICYSSDGPAVDEASNAQFMAFGREHKDLLYELGIRFHVTHQFEYGDFVPQAGETHLGTTEDTGDTDALWLYFSASVFRPTDTTRVPELVTPTTAHARRIAQGVEGVDYTVTDLTQKDLWDFHHSYLLRGKIQRSFGFKILRTPELAERVRRAVGLGTRPFMKAYQWWAGNQLGSRDDDGIFAIDDGHKPSRAYTYAT